MLTAQFAEENQENFQNEIIKEQVGKTEQMTVDETTDDKTGSWEENKQVIYKEEPIKEEKGMSSHQGFIMSEQEQ